MIIGIDPGFSGAIAGIDQAGEIMFLEDMPVQMVGKKRELDGARVKSLLTRHRVAHVYIEKAQGMPGQGISSTARYMASWGIIIGICVGLGLPYTLVPPHMWKKKMMAGMQKGKGASIIRAQQLYPALRLPRKKDHGKADALLISRYGAQGGGNSGKV